MKLLLDNASAKNYTSQSQKIRVLTESWVDKSIFCPNCGRFEIEQYPNNRPVADFFCAHCKEDYELKSKQNSIGKKIVDGAYRTMLERLADAHNPNFFLLNYDLASLKVKDFLVIPKHFFIPEIIEKRKPLAKTARRAGWVGCNIRLDHIPEAGKIFFVKNQKEIGRNEVCADWKRTLFLRDEKALPAKGWLIDVMRSVERVGKREFSLDEMYAFESQLKKLHPENKHVKDKIRQQLQMLRDKDFIRFLGRGRYQLSHS